MPPRATSPHKIGETHRVELVDAESIGLDYLVAYRDLDRPHRVYRETMSPASAEGLAIGLKGTLALTKTRARPDGRWIFTPFEGQGGGNGS